MAKRMSHRPTRAHNQQVEAATGKLSGLRSQYEQMGPGHPLFTQVLARAALTSGHLAAEARRMSRIHGRSRRAAAARIMATRAVSEEAIAPPPTWQEPDAGDVEEALRNVTSRTTSPATNYDEFAA